MVSSAIWKKHARVSFSKTIKIEKLTRACFSKLHEKPYYYLLIIHIEKIIQSLLKTPKCLIFVLFMLVIGYLYLSLFHILNHG